VKKAIYIGIYSEGSTSKMRGEKLKSILSGWQFDVIDTDIPFTQQPKVFRSLGFRFKQGPVIKAINDFILRNLPSEHYDLVWIDKAVFITKDTTSVIRATSSKLVHYTPDTAFYGNRSKMFYESMNYYDHLITTKTFEWPNYSARVPASKIILITQGFDSDIHKPLVNFENKKNRVAFVGLCEKSREEIVQRLIDNKIHVVLAGNKWENFIKKNINNPFLDFKGRSLWNEDYSSLISTSYFSLGLLSKRFPELHTTRSFEIPACGTALLTEKNDETSSFFSDEEVIFYKDPHEMVKKIKYYQDHVDELKKLTDNGLMKVNQAGFDYNSILRKVISQVM
jgi:hypothetical protein